MKTINAAYRDHWKEVGELLSKYVPIREREARNALEMAVARGLRPEEQNKVFLLENLPEVVAWHTLTDDQLSRVSARLHKWPGNLPDSTTKSLNVFPSFAGLKAPCSL